MAYSVTPLAGEDLINKVPTNTPSFGTTQIPTNGPLGLEVFGSDGLRYVLAQAGNAFTSGETSVTVSPTTFVATSTGGAYIAPVLTGGLSTGDYAWFGKASV